MGLETARGRRDAGAGGGRMRDFAGADAAAAAARECGDGGVAAAISGDPRRGRAELGEFAGGGGASATAAGAELWHDGDGGDGDGVATGGVCRGSAELRRGAAACEHDGGRRGARAGGRGVVVSWILAG